MNLSQANKDRLTFQLADREKLLLLELLKLYPLMPPTYHQRNVSQKREIVESQKLIDEALAERRSENKKQLQILLQHGNRFVKSEEGWQFSITRGELEWLLQVLNDVRVGSWIALGSPNPKTATKIALTHENAQYFWAMDLCGHFESDLVNALLNRADETPDSPQA